MQNSNLYFRVAEGVYFAIFLLIKKCDAAKDPNTWKICGLAVRRANKQRICTK